MKIDITTTTIANGQKSVTTEKNIDKQMQTYKGFKVGQIATTKVVYFDYKDKIEAGTNFIIVSFPPYPMKKGSFVYGKTYDNKSVRLSTTEISAVKS